jgi:propanediol utilization protein
MIQIYKFATALKSKEAAFIISIECNYDTRRGIVNTFTICVTDQFQYQLDTDQDEMIKEYVDIVAGDYHRYSVKYIAIER